MSEFEDLMLFVKAMEAEYLRHYPQKGESWKQDGKFLDPRSSKAYPQYFNQDQYLRNAMFNCLQKYSRKHDPSELVDIANLCAMLWMRSSGNSPNTTGDKT